MQMQMRTSKMGDTKSLRQLLGPPHVRLYEGTAICGDKPLASNFAGDVLLHQYEIVEVMLAYRMPRFLPATEGQRTCCIAGLRSGDCIIATCCMNGGAFPRIQRGGANFFQ
jgi:hypothetical protein